MAALFKVYGQQPLKYNQTSTSLYAPICDGRLQCYSSTLLFLETAKELWGPRSATQGEPIVIFTSGHITPVFVRPAPQPDELEVFGLETIAGGDALVSFGLASKLHERNEPVRIFLAEDFQEIEKLKFIGTDREILGAKVQGSLVKAAQKLGIELEALEQQIREIQEQSGSDQTEDVNATAPGFGRAFVPAGDLDRIEFEFMQAVKGGHPNRLRIVPPILKETHDENQRMSLQRREVASMLIHSLIGAAEDIGKTFLVEERAKKVIQTLEAIDDRIWCK